VLARRLPASFYPVNGLHARGITAEMAVLMRRAGFVRACLSLETVDPVRQQGTGAKVTTTDF